MLTDVVNRNKQTSLNAFDEVTYKYLGVKGKDNIMNVINKLPDDLITPDIKNMLSITLDSGFMLPEEEEETGGRTKRESINRSRNRIAVLFASISAVLKIAGKEQTKSEHPVYGSPVYRWCNDPAHGWWRHIVTVSYCISATITANVIAVIDGKPLDLKGLGNVFCCCFLSILTFFFFENLGDTIT